MTPIDLQELSTQLDNQQPQQQQQSPIIEPIEIKTPSPPSTPSPRKSSPLPPPPPPPVRTNTNLSSSNSESVSNNSSTSNSNNNNNNNFPNNNNNNKENNINSEDNIKIKKINEIENSFKKNKEINPTVTLYKEYFISENMVKQEQEPQMKKSSLLQIKNKIIHTYTNGNNNNNTTTKRQAPIVPINNNLTPNASPVNRNVKVSLFYLLHILYYCC